MKKVFFIILFLIFFIQPFILIFQYDIYSYHVWSYNSIKFGIDKIYNRELFFDRFCDYLPFGSYLAIFQGRIISLFTPLKLCSVPYLNFYKIFPLFILFSVFVFLYRNKFSLLKILILTIPFYISIVLNGQFDIVILFLLFISIFFMERKDFVFGSFILTLLFFSKQTAPFFVTLIVLHYFKENRNKDFLFKVFFTFLITTSIIFLPFIVSGKILKTLNLIYQNSTYMLPFSGYSFNLLSLVSYKNNFDPSKNYFNISLTSYSLFLIIVTAIFISFFVKGSIFKKLSLFSLVWFNLLVGLRENHILYPLFFLFFLIDRNRKGAIFNLLFFLFYFFSILNIIVFFFNFVDKKVFFIFSFFSVVSSFILFFVILREKDSEISIKNAGSLKICLFITILLILFVNFIPLTNYDRDEKNFFGELIMSNDILEYSKDRFMDLNIKTFSPFSHYLSLRMSDLSFIKFKNLNSKYRNLKMFLVVEGNDSAKLTLNDSISVIIKKDKFNFIRFENFSILNDTINIKAKTFKKNSNVVIYNVTF